MIEYIKEQNQFRICITIPDIEGVRRYHQSLINLLDKIEIDECDQALKEDLSSVYELLLQLLPDKNFLNQYNEHLNELG